ncbi:fido (protein-threonine AMPylation protein) [Agromyces terreus]|uniref:Fido (Protein-threonine AMPylation protein) n=1 Tax=Agromyces terreus TaxID=424795 RepID=A0A9X2KCW3_9MICO|nr:Fic family protein [Agromyces terreus]MCP2371786.1 fido (protein-threonine AMPylation protein) [Agromyces terreus]
MTFDPGYGETPLDPDDADALTAEARAVVGDPPLRAAIFELEQAIEQAVALDLINAVLRGELGVDDLLTPGFVFDLHARLYGAVWTWAGRPRVRLLSIGVDPAQVQVDLHATLDNLAYRWANTSDWDARQLGIAVHAELVRIHPFVDGNGRATRLIGDLIYLAAQGSESPPTVYDWSIDKRTYIDLLRVFDQNRDPIPLGEFVPVIVIE